MSDRITDALTLVDGELDEHERLKAEAVELVADNPWCVTALRRRGIEVPS